MIDSLVSPIAYPFDVSRAIAPGGGKTFFVRSLTAALGSDDNEGTDPEFPLLKIQAAIDKCDQRRHDYIFVQDSFQADTVSILLNERNIHLIGLGDGAFQNGGRAIVDMQGVDACFKTYGAGGGVELAGFRMGSDGEACIELYETSWMNHIHHCSFAHLFTAGCQDGILAESGAVEMHSWLVDHCYFGQGITRDAIRVDHCNWSFFNHNFFVKDSGRAIYIHDGGYGGILGNVFFSALANALAAGWAIDIQNHDMMVTGNKASATGTDAGNNPYRDRSAATAATLLNGWADNFDGPALSAGPDAP